MNENNPPKALGVFSPAGHVVASFPHEEDMRAAASALEEAGFQGPDLVRYSPEQMKSQVDLDLQHASPLASLGQEVNLVKAHRALAEQGYHFLVVHAAHAAQTKTVAEIVKRHHAERAQKYGSFIIEELIDDVGEDQQVFESPSRGSDERGHPGPQR